MKCQIWVFGFYLTFAWLWKLRKCASMLRKKSETESAPSDNIFLFPPCRQWMWQPVYKLIDPPNSETVKAVYICTITQPRTMKYGSLHLRKPSANAMITNSAACHALGSNCVQQVGNAMVRPAVPRRQPWFANPCQVTPASMLCLFPLICLALPW